MIEVLRLRPYKKSDAERIVSWIIDEYAFRQWCADRYDHFPITPDDINAMYEGFADADWFYPMTAFDESGVVGHMIMRFTDDAKEVLRFGFIIIDASKRGQGYGKEMLSLAVRFAFGILKAKIVTLGVFDNNPTAYHCYRSAGFREAQTNPGHYRVFGEDWKCLDMIYGPEEVELELQDTEWPFEFTDHDRTIVRAVVIDAEGYYYFVRAERDDEFGRATLIETSGGGVEEGEDLVSAIRRELREELGVEAEVICKLGFVSDYYNLIHRHNLNHYYLCRAVSFGDRHLNEDEIEDFHLSTLKLTFEEAVAEYEKRRESRVGRLIANRELPVLQKAREMLP